MKYLMKGVQRFAREDDGVTMVEYGLLAALIAVVCIIAITNVGTELNVVFTNIASALKGTG